MISRYIESKHIKITGLKIIKRNVTPLQIRFYLRIIENVLNKNDDTGIIELLHELKENINMFDM